MLSKKIGLYFLLLFSLAWVFPSRSAQAATDMMTMIANRDVILNNSANFTFTMVDFNGQACSTCTYTVVTSPPETVNKTKSGNQVSGDFLATRLGTYSLIVTVTDSGNHTQKKNFLFFSGATQGAIRTYMRGSYPTHGPWPSNGHDGGSLRLAPPVATEIRTCGNWVQDQLDELPVDFPYSSFLLGVNIHARTNGLEGGAGIYGIQRVGTFGGDIDRSSSVTLHSTTTPNDINFSDLGWDMRSTEDWYKVNIKLWTLGQYPRWVSTVSEPSYTDFTYSYASTPSVNKNSQTDSATTTILLSATASSTDTKSVSLVLDNVGSAVAETSLTIPGLGRPFTDGLSNINSFGQTIINVAIPANSSTTLTTVPLDILPSTGLISVRVGTWTASYKQWSEASADSPASATHLVSGLTASTSYTVKINNTVFDTYTSDSQGQLTFTYNGIYTVNNIFELFPSTDSPVLPVKFWYKAGVDANWATRIGNWWNDISHTVQSASLPSASDSTIILGSTSPSANLDSWTTPNNINASSSPIIFSSSRFLSPLVNITGNASFTSSSANKGVVSGNAIFGNSSYNAGVVKGTAKFTYATGGTITIPDGGQWSSGTAGALTGNDDNPITAWIFNGTSLNYGTISNAIFNSTSDNQGTTTNAIFNTSSHNDNQATNATFNGTSFNAGYVSDATFNNSSFNDSVVNAAVFNDLSFNESTVINTAKFNSAVGGTMTVSDGSHWGVGSVQSLVGSDNQPITNWVFNGSSMNFGVLINATFNNSTYNDGGTINEAIFNDSSNNLGQTFVQGATFNGLSYNAGVIQGVAKFTNGSGGILTLEDGGQWGRGTASVITGNDNLPINRWIFNGSSVNNGVSSNAIFNDSSSNQNLVTGAIFNDSSLNMDTANNATFNDSSTNNGIVFDATFNDSSYNMGPATNAIFNGEIADTTELISGTKTRRYTSNVVTNRDFISDAPWIVIADNAVVNVTGADYNGSTVFKIANGGSFLPSNIIPIHIYSPIMTTQRASNINQNSVVLNANVSDFGGENITQHGFIYGQDSSLNSIIATTKLGAFSGNGNFFETLSGLPANTKYFFRAYATNFVGTSTGTIKSFITAGNNSPFSSPPAIGDGVVSVSIAMAQSQDIGLVETTGVNTLSYVGSNIGFKVPAGSSQTIENHQIKVIDLDLWHNIITLQIVSQPQLIKIKLNETANVDLDNNKTSDISIKFTSLYVNRAELTIKSLIHSVPEIVTPDKQIILPITEIKPAITAITSNYLFKRNLKTGMRGTDIKELQKYLNAKGFIVSKSGPGAKGKETAMFGAATRSALMKFQKANKISPANGWFGDSTRQLINN